MKVYRDQKYTLVAVCDDSLLGQNFRQGKVRLDVRPEFYGGTLTSMDAALTAVERADIVNLVGGAVIGAAITRGLVDTEAVIKIAGIPHVQIVKL